jgi:hypothetical protein
MSVRANIPQDVLVPISVGELIDKIVILEIKSERIKNANQLANIANELGALRAVRLGDVARARLDALSAELKRVNAKLWDVEDSIRECDARGDFGDNFTSSRAPFFVATANARGGRRRSTSSPVGAWSRRSPISHSSAKTPGKAVDRMGPRRRMSP